MGKRELIALLNLSSWCLVMVERLFLTVPRGCLRFVIVVFPDHTHLLFFSLFNDCKQKIMSLTLGLHDSTCICLLATLVSPRFIRCNIIDWPYQSSTSFVHPFGYLCFIFYLCYTVLSVLCSLLGTCCVRTLVFVFSCAIVTFSIGHGSGSGMVLDCIDSRHDLYLPIYMYLHNELINNRTL